MEKVFTKLLESTGHSTSEIDFAWFECCDDKAVYDGKICCTSAFIEWLDNLGLSTDVQGAICLTSGDYVVFSNRAWSLQPAV